MKKIAAFLVLVAVAGAIWVYCYPCPGGKKTDGLILFGNVEVTEVDLGFKAGLSTDEGIKLAVRAIESGKRRDIYSGGKSVSVLVVDKSGIRILSEKEIAPIIQQVKVTL